MDYEDIIVALKDGNVPSYGATEICVGREKELNEIKKLLIGISEGKSYARFINGEFGAGKSFFLKMIEEYAFENNYVISKITLNSSIPFNKIETVYRSIVSSLKCKTGSSLKHIIDKWIINYDIMLQDEEEDQDKRNAIIRDNLLDDLEDARICENSFAAAIENYYYLTIENDNETANYAQAWLRGNTNIPFKYKNKFGVKGDVTRENAFKFLGALSIFLKTIGYSGLVVLIDEAEHIMTLHTKKIRDTAYENIRLIYDESNGGNFKNSLFVFAGTNDFFDTRLGIFSYDALRSRIEGKLDNSEHKDYRKPIIELEGFSREELIEVADEIMEIHKEVYDWDPQSRINSCLDEIINIHEANAELKRGRVTPREFIIAFVSVLDTIQQNPNNLTDDSAILKLFGETEEEIADEDDW